MMAPCWTGRFSNHCSLLLQLRIIDVAMPFPFTVALCWYAGLRICYAYQKTGSLPFITAIHEIINIFLSGLLPHPLIVPSVS